MKMIYFQTRFFKIYFCSFVVLRLKRRRVFFLRNTPKSIYVFHYILLFYCFIYGICLKNSNQNSHFFAMKHRILSSLRKVEICIS